MMLNQSIGVTKSNILPTAAPSLRILDSVDPLSMVLMEPLISNMNIMSLGPEVA